MHIIVNCLIEFQLSGDISELRELMSNAKRPRVKDILSIEIRKLETALTTEREKAEKNGATNNAEKAKRTIKAAYDVQIKNYCKAQLIYICPCSLFNCILLSLFLSAWDQSDKFVKIFLTGLDEVHKLPEESVKKDFKKGSVEVKVCDLKGKNPTFSIKHLCKDIDPEKSYVKIKTGDTFGF